ncbi:hypothetical protein TeGR_g6897 [Tetraparma gracilis]|nr:hypothetical protein TeGR_g6897 [Tetraparma gracilis]
MPSWSSAASLLSSQQTPAEASFRARLAAGTAASPLASLRLFDGDAAPKVTFYRDSASWCPYSHGVWLQLEAKRISYQVEKVNMRCYGQKPASFQRLQPSGAIPVLEVIGGGTYKDSADIMLALEEQFPASRPLGPAAADAGRYRELFRLERELFSAWMGYLTSGRGRAGFLAVLGKVEAALAAAAAPGYFLGGRMTLVDVKFMPFLERIDASMCYFKGIRIRGSPDFPSITRWFEAMEEEEGYRITKSDIYTHCWDLPPQIGGCVQEEAGVPFKAAIDGGDWHLGEGTRVVEEGGWDWVGEEEAWREVAERFIANHDAVARFGARGGSRPGFPSYSAPLVQGGPNSKVDEAVIPLVDDALLWLVCKSLGDRAGAEAQVEKIKACDPKARRLAAASVEYLRDRVGVPRDMTLPAASRARGAMNELLTQI